MNRFPRKALLLASCALMAGCLDLTLPPAPTGGQNPALTIGSIAPDPVTVGAVATIAFSADQALTTCGASVGARPASCTVLGTGCSCTLTVGADALDGENTVTIRGVSATGSATAEGIMNVDKTPPVVTASFLAIHRNPLGTPDTVSAAAGGAVDPGAAYTGRKVKEVRLYASDVDPLVLATAVPSADGSWSAVDLGGNDQTAPARVFAEAVDAAGLVSGRVEIAAGEDITGPSGDGSRMRFNRVALGAQDSVEGLSGAFVDSSAIATINVYAGSTGGSPFAVAPAGASGAFAPISIGTAIASWQRAYVSAVDKCGNEGPRVEVLVGEDTDGPAAAGTAMQFVRRNMGAQDSVSGSPGAFGGTCALATVTLWTDAGGTAAAGSGAVAANGSFAEIAVGTATSAPGRLWASAVDKCGLTGAAAEVMNGRHLLAPSGDGNQMQFARRDLTAADGVRGNAGALSAEGNAGTVSLFTAPSGGTLVASTTFATDGSFAEVAVGTATSSYGQLWASAVDKTGLSTSGRIEVLGGEDVTPPSGNGSQMQFVRRDFTAPDGVLGNAGAFGAAGCALQSVTLYDAAANGNAIATAPLASNGSFSEVSIGTSSRSVPRAWAVANDKCNNPSARVEVLVGPDTAAPAADGTKATLELFPPGQNELLSGAAGSSSDPVSTVQAFSAATGGLAFGTPTRVAADGSFALTDIGDANRDRVYLEAADKAGNASTRMLVKHVSAVLDLNVAAGATTDEAMFAAAVDGDPRTATPGYVVASGQRLTGSALGGALAIDSSRAATAAATETRSVAASWTILYAPPSGPSSRFSSGMTWDSSRGQIVLVDGHDGTGPLQDSWADEAPQTWTHLFPSSPPAARFGPVLVFDAMLGADILFGTNDGADPAGESTFALGGSTWSTLAATGPSRRYNAAAAYDSVRGRTVMFGGRTPAAPGTGTSETWEFDGARWSQISTAATPPPRYGASMIFDPVRGKAVLFGGTGTSGALGDTWEYDGVNWAPVTTPAGLTARSFTSFAYAPSLRKAVLTGAMTSPEAAQTWYFNGTWASSGVTGSYRFDAPFVWDVVRNVGLQYSGRAAPGGSVVTGGLEYQEVSPHARYGAHAFAFVLGGTAAPSSLVVDYTGAGRGDAGGTATWGVELLIWNWSTRAWVSLGQHAAADTAAAANRLISATPPGSLSSYVSNGRLWLMAAPLNASSAPPSAAVADELDTDYVRVSMDYALP